MGRTDDLKRMYYSKYGSGWKEIRAAALKRAGGKCEIGDGHFRGLCTASTKAKVHVHHVGVFTYVLFWPILRFEDVDSLLLYAYQLAWMKRQEELEWYLANTPAFFPVLCSHHHSLMEYSDNAQAMLQLLMGR